MTTTARLGAISIDCSDPAALARFYQQVLDLELLFESPDMAALKGAAVLLTFQRVADHQPPQWPAGVVPKQLHLELAAADLDAEEARILGLGATKAETQPNPGGWRVLIDPAGHPFCITNLIPEGTYS
ncbi:VOC family protein [Mycobacteroides salmoniphilum]|uniref:Glyoxalase-like domain protein n=1 Tax=Mycobacteroides salmoniphilum TaxID=404941 RepID=A0A4R8SUZ2_9MYCO|nr:VOC family protein [Mycobacteroides salmoniphilum]QCH23449.1 Glyoxalase-like domain protein [Mycobacteroides salmoniphilum]TEA04021.1 Glyoxalase-like domain protein [Mycobacteroides salmoniphilum]